MLTGIPGADSSAALAADLRALGFQVAEAVTAAEVTARLAAAPAAEPVAVVDGRFVGHRHALRLALTDPRFDAAAIPGALLVRPATRPALARALEPAETGKPAASVPPRPCPAGGARPTQSATSPIGQTSTAQLAAQPPAPPPCPPGGDPLPDLLARALEAAGTAVHRPELGVLVAAVPLDEDGRAAARTAVAAVDEEAVRLRSAVKSRDGFFTTHFVSPYSRYLARWCARRGLSPNQVTTASLLVALAAGAFAATGTRAGYIVAGVLLLASFVLDCADGQLARYALRYSTLGAWLDATFDRVKEYAFYAGLALGAARGGDDVWALALGAMVLQTCRHVVDFAFTEANSPGAARTAGTAGPDTGGAADGRAVQESPVAALSGRLDAVGWTIWARRMIVLPIGERWALIAVLTAVTTPRTTFVVLLIGCALAACYTTSGRVLRSVAGTAPRTARAARALADLADSGPLAETVAAFAAPRARRLPALAPPAIALAGAGVLTATAALAPPGSGWPVLAAVVYVLAAGLAVARPLEGALDWLVPLGFRAGEYGTVLALAAVSKVNGALPAAFLLVAVVAYHHYDTVYRIRGGAGAPPRTLVRAAGGHEGRALLVAVLAAAFGHRTGFPIALTALAVVLAALVLVESVRFWVSAGAPAVHDVTGEPA